MVRLPNITPFRFRIALLVVLGALFAFLQIPKDMASTGELLDVLRDGRLHVFFHEECPHCRNARAFLKTTSGVDYVLHDVGEPENEALFLAVAKHHRIPSGQLGVPFFVFGSHYLVGFGSAETTGPEILALYAGRDPMAEAAGGTSLISLPLIGDIDPSGYSLLALTAVMGLSDGFNPCAMWVLVYLISLIAALEDKRKIWWLVGTFVLASGVLYYLFMTAWLTAFLFVGFIRPLTQLIALLAIGFGLDHLFELAVKQGVIACEVGSPERRQKTMQWARELVAAPVGLLSLLMIVGLAFAVNSIEFVCSAALPAIYTHVLTLTDMSPALYYGYIGLYVLFFMLDDLIVFALAAFAVQKVIDTRYAAVSRAVGGVILLALGVWMLLR